MCSAPKRRWRRPRRAGHIRNPNGARALPGKQVGNKKAVAVGKLKASANNLRAEDV